MMFSFLYGAPAPMLNSRDYKLTFSKMYSPPAQRLVGIEPNPGPEIIELLSTTQGKKKKNNKGRTPRKGGVRTVQSAGPRRRNRHRVAKNSSLSPNLSFARNWRNLMADPWGHVPTRLGLGTMVPTAIYSLYLRSSINCNIDGSFALCLLPVPYVSSVGPIMHQAAGAGTPTWTASQWYNVGGAAAAFGLNFQYRTLAAGLRIIPSIAGTAAPGELAVGSLPCTFYDGAKALTPYSILANNFVKVGNARDGAYATSRPQDLTSFEFVLPTFTATSEVKWSAPLISGVGLPASTTIYYEAVMHIEVLGDQTSYAIPGGESGLPQQTSGWASIDQLWSYVSSSLPSSSSVTSHFESLNQTVSNVSRLASLAGAAYTTGSNGNFGRRLKSEL